jgi:UDP-N-acetylmuramoyl-tripeptide--D-alanyl-D-alanine ligase
MSLWSAAEAEAATLGQASAPFAASGLSIDTRSLKPGDLFVALKGVRDGHDFVAAAFKAGARAAMVAHAVEGAARELDNAPLLTVAHTQRGLEDLGAAGRARARARVVAVTGSAGKTTTKEILRLCFDALGKTHASAASHNNQWGVPLSLAALPPDADYGIFEVGMNHFGEIRALTALVRPHVALVTTIAPAHLEFFGSCEAIADAKSEIFERLEPGGAALIPADNPFAGRLAARARQARVSVLAHFGIAAGNEAQLVSHEPDGEGLRLKANIFGTRVDAKVGAPGAHIAANAVAALGAVALLGGDVLNAAAALRNFTALAGRGARFTAKGVDVIDESYNANPASMAAALLLLKEAKGRRIAVLGDMLEMGAGGPAHHAGLARPIADADVDLVFAAGPLMKALWDELPSERRGAWAENSADLKPRVLAALAAGDTVLVKGSNGARMSLIVEALKV